ncbi:MAG: AraC family transcriptional regulator [Arenicella sp.]
MNNVKTKYTKRFEIICDYIFEHLDDNLSIDELSQVGHFSKYHFHRQFSALMGISVFKYIQLMRLKRASYQLVFHQDCKVIDVALDAGFENPESFSRAFKKTFKQTPSEFRRQPKWSSWYEKYIPINYRGTHIMQVNIVEFNETQVAVLEHRGDVGLLNDSVQTFMEWRKDSGLSPVESSHTYGLAYDDPKTVKAAKFRFDICGAVLSKVPENKQGIVNKVIPSGRCAVIKHKGSHDLMGEKVHYLYGQWLPENDEETRDFPCFFHYLNFFPEVPENELVTHIYLPLK